MVGIPTANLSCRDMGAGALTELESSQIFLSGTGRIYLSKEGAAHV